MVQPDTLVKFPKYSISHFACNTKYQLPRCIQKYTRKIVYSLKISVSYTSLVKIIFFKPNLKGIWLTDLVFCAIINKDEIEKIKLCENKGSTYLDSRESLETLSHINSASLGRKVLPYKQYK